jgi:hypothetical protein
MNNNPYIDHAAPILAGEPTITDDDRSNLWDIFHGSKDSEELVQKLQSYEAPDHVKASLFDAKHASMPGQEPVAKTLAAISKVKEIPADVLDLAESHPNVLKALTGAANTPEKEAGKPAGEGKPVGDGKVSTAKKTPLVAPDVPVTPAGHALVHTSDHRFHHIPVANIDKARQIDPNLTVLHTEA